MSAKDRLAALHQAERDELTRRHQAEREQELPGEATLAGMVTYEVRNGALRVPLRVGVVSETGVIVLLAEAPVTVLADPASTAALQETLEQAVTDQARIHRQLYPADAGGRGRAD
jgi:hypothetical protein